MNLIAAKFSPRFSRWAVGLCVFAGALVYLVQWLQMPLYPDEIAFRILRSRYFADGPTGFGLLPCNSNTQLIPIIFRPVAYALSAFDVEFGWSLLRTIPVAGILLTIATTLFLTLRQGAIEASLIVAAGLVGVAGSGLVLLRGEAPMLFLGASCLIGYALIARSNTHPVMAGTYLIVTTWLSLLAFFVHPQALVLAPVLLAIAAALGFQQRSWAIKVVAGLSIICTLAGAWTSLSSSRILCTEFNVVEAATDAMGLPGFAKQEGWPAVESYLKEKLPSYADQFSFRTKYDSNYLPDVDAAAHGESLPILNAALQYTAMLNLILAFCTMIVSAALSASILFKKGGSLGQNLLSLLRAPSIYMFLAIAGYLALLAYDVSTAFYRNFHVHLMLVMLNALALSSLRGSFRRMFLPIGLACFVLSLWSALISQQEMGEKFAAGWVGPSIRLDTDWQAIRADVKQAENVCQIAAGDSGIVIDDLTYDAMKHHRHLIPITYLLYKHKPDGSAPEIKSLLRSISATAAVARCELFRSVGLNPQHQSNGICCLKL